MTVNEFVHKTLRDDTTLHTLLSKTVTPYGIYYMSPPEKPDIPIITHFSSSRERSSLVDGIYYNITAWGNTFEAILNQIRILLHKNTTTVTDYHNLMFLYIYSNSELWDDDLKCYYRQDVYLCKGIKT